MLKVPHFHPTISTFNRHFKKQHFHLMKVSVTVIFYLCDKMALRNSVQFEAPCDFI